MHLRSSTLRITQKEGTFEICQEHSQRTGRRHLLDGWLANPPNGWLDCDLEIVNRTYIHSIKLFFNQF